MTRRSVVPVVSLQAAAVRRIAGRYPFGQAKDILEAPSGLAAGEVVSVRAGGKVIGRAYWNEHNTSKPLRMLTWQDEDIDLAFYERRLKEAADARAGRIWGTNAWRMVNAEADGLPGLVVDRFGEALAVQLRNAGTERHRDLILKALRRHSDAACAYERSDTIERKKEGLGLTGGVLWGELPEEVHFFEDDLQLFFEPMAAQKTGFFLDQRDNRRMMRSLVPAGGHFLDVCSYTGAFSLHAARAGALALALDKDGVALATLERVARKNGLSVGVRLGDFMESLTQLGREKRQFDAIVFDPPTLVKRHSDLPRAKKVFADGTERCLQLLAPGGHLLLSTCAHHLGTADLLDAARVAAGALGCEAEVVTVTHQPADHPHRLSVPESLYLKSILLRKVNG